VTAASVFLATYGFLVVSMALASLLALSLYIPFLAGQLSLASPGFYALGGYIAAVLATRVLPSAAGYSSIPSLLLEMVLAALAAGLLAIVVGVPALRLRGIYFALATIAFVEILRVLSLNLEITGGAVGIFGVPQPFATQLGYLWIVAPLLLAGMAFMWRLERTRAGRALVALREDELAADAMGVNPTYYKTLAFTMGAMLAGVVGAISAHFLNTWNARQGTFDASVSLLAFVLIGGSRTFVGPVVGGLVLTALPEVLRAMADVAGLPAWLARFLKEGRLIIFGTLIALGSVFFPRGLITPEILPGHRRAGAPRPRPDRRARSALAPGPAPGNAQVPSADPGSRPRGTGRPHLAVRGVSCRFGGLVAVHDVSLEVADGEIFGIIGPNGAGKTTLFNLITGLTRPSGGHVVYRGGDITGLPPHRVAGRGIARTFQNVRLFGTLSVLDNLLIAQHLRTRTGIWSGALALPAARAEEREIHRRAWELLELVGLADRAPERALSLPYGDQRRLEIARALALGPATLLMDEPAAGMNAGEKRELSAFIREIRARFDLTVMLIEHHVPLVMGLCDRVAVLNFGQLIALGDPGEVQHNPAVVEAYLGN
jgi:branched-chain amino acid transport system permease protein